MYTRKEADRISVGLTPETQTKGMVIRIILESVLEEMIEMKMKVVGDYIVDVTGTPRATMTGTEVEGGHMMSITKRGAGGAGETVAAVGTVRMAIIPTATDAMTSSEIGWEAGGESPMTTMIQSATYVIEISQVQRW